MAPGTVTLLGYMMRMMAWANILPMPFFVVLQNMFHVKHAYDNPLDEGVL